MKIKYGSESKPASMEVNDLKVGDVFKFAEASAYVPNRKAPRLCVDDFGRYVNLTTNSKSTVQPEDRVIKLDVELHVLGEL